ncbi:MAG: MBL fold metallo-hydrolase, partial [Pseudomonadota bacterium]|nr:MBL fold metallo-hydrolase [Pseudomonadota bacterium]
EGTTTVLIDTTPDMRSQLLDTGTGRLDGVVYTHSHADHVHGIDDLRMIVFNMRERVPVYADGDTQNALLSRFGYAFIQPEGSPYPPILDLRQIDGPLTISGPGGDITLRPFEVNHGSIEALGFRIGDLANLPDVAQIPDSALDELRDLECWIIDALRRKPHPTHLCLDEALEWIERMAPKRAVLTNMHIDLDYAQVAAETPDHVDPAYDGMVIEYPI